MDGEPKRRGQQYPGEGASVPTPRQGMAGGGGTHVPHRPEAIGLCAEEGLREGGRLRRADVEGTAWPLPGWLELNPLREEEHC